jgi:hypothetical protein
MMMLKSILDSLKPSDRNRLMHAFENHFGQYISLPDNKFIAVNLSSNNFKIEERAGVWSYGTIKTN